MMGKYIQYGKPDINFSRVKNSGLPINQLKYYLASYQT